MVSATTHRDRLPEYVEILPGEKEGRFVFDDPSSARISPDNSSTSSIIKSFKAVGEPGAFARNLSKDRVVKPQNFAESVVFKVDTKDGPVTFLYKTPEGQDSTLYAHKGELTGISGKLEEGFEKVHVAKISGMIAETIKTADFAETHFADEKLLPKDIELAHGYIGQVGYFSGDPWSIVASIESIRAVTLGVNADPGVMNKLTSSFGLVTGPVTILSAIKGRRAAYRIGDVEGQINHNIRLVRGTEEFLSGGLMAGVRSVGLAASLPTASKAIIVANKVLGYISTVAGSVLYALLMIPFILDAVREGNFLSDFAKKKAEGIETAFMHLVDMVGLTESDMSEVAKTFAFDTPQELYDMVKDGEKAPENLNKTLTKNEMIAIEDRVLEKLHDLDPEDFPLISDWDQVRDCLLAKALKEGDRIISKNKAEYTRRASFGSYSDIREKMMTGEIGFDGFKYTIPKGEKATAFQESMNVMATNEVHSNLMLNTFVAFVCIIGIASFVGATIFTGGAPLLVSLVVMLVMNVMMAGVDLYAFMEELRAMKTASTNDMVTLAIFAIMSIVSLSIGMVFAGSPVARGVIVALGAIILSFQGGAAYEVYQRLGVEEEEEDDIELSWQGRAQMSTDDEGLRRLEKTLKLERRAMQVRAALEKGGFGI